MMKLMKYYRFKMKSLKCIFMIAFACMVNLGSSFYRAKSFLSTKISNNFCNNNREKSSIRPAHLAIIRSNPISSIFSPDIYPIFEEAVLFNAAQALILTLFKQKSLTNQGLIHATILGIGLWTFLGFKGWIICVTYLILGSLATKVKMSEKEKLGIAEKRGGARGPENVWGSAAAAMICAMLTYFYPNADLALKVGYVASIASKLSDTLGSELGKAFGKTTYLITTMKLVPRGTEGAVSLEGTVSGVIGSVIIAAVSLAVGILPSWNAAGICVLAAFIATTLESYIGAIYQNKISWLNNELVNLFMTTIGAVLGVILAALLIVK